MIERISNGRNIFLFFLFFNLFIYTGIASAESSYPQTGGLDSDWNSDLSFFNADLTGDTTASRSLNQPQGQPYVADLDNDGLAEIIIKDGSSIKIYNYVSSTNSLTFLKSFTLPQNSPISNMVAQDMDADAFIELMFADEMDEQLYFLEWNGTHFFNETTHDLGKLHDHSGSTDYYGQMLIGCADNDICLLTYSDSNVAININSGDVYAVGFDENSVSNEINLEDEPALNTMGCFPKIRAMSIEDINLDGINEFSVPFHLSTSFYIYQLNVNDSLNVTKTGNRIRDVGVYQPGGISNCSKLGNTVYYTSPLVADVSDTDGYETIYAVMNADDTFQIKMYDKNYNFIDRYPNTLSAEGMIISNPFLADAFIDPDFGVVDVCVVGYEEEEREISINCGTNKKDPGFGNIETQIYDYDMSDNLFNLSGNSLLWTANSHSLNIQGNQFTEILTPYGIFELESTAICRSTGQCSSNLIYTNTVLSQENSIISVDIEGVGWEDLITITPTNLWVINDGFTNTQAYIDGNMNLIPCIKSQPVKQNETLRVTFKVSDLNGDQVNATVILYDGEGDDQQLQSEMGASGSTFTFDFILINLTTSSIFTVEIRDDVDTHQNNPFIDNFTYAITTTGVTFDSGCEDNIVYTAPGINETIIPGEITPEDQEALANAIAPPSLIPPQYRVLWGVLLMVIIGGAVLYGLIEEGVRNSSVLIIIPTMVLLICWIFLVGIGILPGWTLMVGILFGAVALGFKFKDQLGSVIRHE